MKRHSIILIALLSLIPCLSNAVRIDEIGVGRFGAGKRITANTASQDLLALSVHNTGAQLELKTYDADARGVSLGLCGFSVAQSSKVTNEVHSIGWTQLTSSYTLGNDRIDVLESLLTPVVWFKVTGKQITLFQNDPTLESTISISNIVDGNPVIPVTKAHPASKGLPEPWMIVTVETKGKKIPLVLLFHHNPVGYRVGVNGLQIDWKTSGSWVGILPLNASHPGGAIRGELKQDVEKCRQLARSFLRVPLNLKETYAIKGKRLVINNQITFDSSIDDWNWGKNSVYAPVPSGVALAKQYGYDVTYGVKPTDYQYPCYLGPFLAVKGSTTLRYGLSLPALDSVISAPTNDPALTQHLPLSVQKTIGEYSDFVIRSYAKRERFAIFPNSALGEARMLASDYPNVRMMSPEARSVFESWADWAVKDRTYNFKACYDYGIEAGRNQKFLLDNYRFSAKDYMDAGWFGYSIQAMWSRAYYSNKWDEVKQNWPQIKELFYGWNWLYLDYAANCAPLYIDADNGGNPKGYTDSMSMLGALYSWARMAEHLSDKPALNDMLYMLAKDRLGRYTRMAVHDWSKRCGYNTDVYFLTSDMGNGPNIAMTSRYIPAKTLNPNVDVVDYGAANGGLWYISGSFLEPVTAETIDMIGFDVMKSMLDTTQRLLDARYARWWASPAAGEIANYQLYLRGALYNEDPNLLRYIFDYQNNYQTGIWLAESWHSNAFTGIVMSTMRGLERQNDWTVSTFDKTSLDRNLWILEDRRYAISIYSNATTPVEAEVTFQTPLAFLGSGPWIDLHTNEKIRQAEGHLFFTLKPGLNLFAQKHQYDLVARVPTQIQALCDESSNFEIVLENRTDQAIPLSITSPMIVAEPIESIPAHSTRKIKAFTAGEKAPYLTRQTWLKINGEEHPITILTLPSNVQILDLKVPKVSQTPKRGVVNLSAVNRLSRAMEITFAWGIDGKQKEAKTLTIPAEGKANWEFELNADGVTQGKHKVYAEVVGKSRKEFKQIVLGNDHKPIVLFDFEEDSENWYMPDWALANNDAQGKKLNPSRLAMTIGESKGVLVVPLSFGSEAKSEGFISYSPQADWSSFATISADVFVPQDAPKELLGSFYLMGRAWKWRLPVSSVHLKPGQWNHLVAPLRGDAVQAFWGIPEKDMAYGLTELLDVGLRFTKNKGVKPFKGTFLVDNVTVETIQKP